jgi:hypothetical protein
VSLAPGATLVPDPAPALRRAVGRVSAHLGADAAERVAAVATLLTVLVGLWLRARGYLWDQSGLWLDETSWAMRIFERPLVQSLIRPLGFLAASKLLAATFSSTETVLRALPWGAGVAALVASPWFARRLYRSPGARVLFVAIVSFSPVAIDFAKEFKPYSVSLALHLGVILLTLGYAASGRGADLAKILGFAAVGSFFAQDLVLAFPGAFLVLGYAAWRKPTHRAATVGVACAIIAGLALQYYLMWRNLPKDHTDFWGAKYNVFYTTHQSQGYLAWSLDRYADLVAMPGQRRMVWGGDWLSPLIKQQVRHDDRLLWVLLHVAGLATIAWQRRWREALLVVLPLAVLWSFNRAGFWPLGAFRTNVFSVVYTGAIAGLAVDTTRGARSIWRALCPATLLVYVPLLAFEERWHAHKQSFTYDSTFPAALDWLVAVRPVSPTAPPEVVVTDRRSCDPWRFYTRYHPRVSRRVAPDLARKFVVKCSTDDARLPRDLLEGAVVGQRVWAVLHVTRPFDRMMKRGMFGNLRVISRHDAGSHTIIGLTLASAGRTAPAAALPPEADKSDED